MTNQDLVGRIVNVLNADTLESTWSVVVDFTISDDPDYKREDADLAWTVTFLVCLLPTGAMITVPHNSEGPASSNQTYSAWLEFGRLHRTDGPASIFYRRNKKDERVEESREYWIDDEEISYSEFRKKKKIKDFPNWVL